jgi:hypothetical protein
MKMTDAGNGNASPTADREVYTEPEMIYRIPGRDAARGEITHKVWRDMNRQERRAIVASRQRVARGRWS